MLKSGLKRSLRNDEGGVPTHGHLHLDLVIFFFRTRARTSGTRTPLGARPQVFMDEIAESG